ncbi:tumor necrosis factor ligand superfamily member 13B isoform X2 [Solea senegalensis]|uniref:Tumor necrosis factor ligand superfamily member 13B isoform X2 n=1 Tax=Solea senegalensis TaxID=28829 RepID=A0AAV6RAT6_SOLSE|nr:tumor necrosis factor ligand superfamily member 13B-like isoform X2 [Solea senegalensis]XP_043872204.1 tumor necrosis factor ligand superfamily member 13B-like isoform X2 [Solea senegalensis]KAG7499509.1 tumor necrosis factor ligand superfamily member 13B isoform X2 [Solea senegalensis]KAG7501759.1 tumor necrosis factor ligand superfamily member 13B isoform X2 [Solea senegalensis]
MILSMAVLTGVKSGAGQRTRKGSLSWPVSLLMLAAVTSSSLSALSLYQLMALRAEVEELKSEVLRKRQEGQEVKRGAQPENIRSSSQEILHQPEAPYGSSHMRRKRMVAATETRVFQPCLQLLADDDRTTFAKGIPWQTGLRRGSAMEADGDSILVKEEGFFFVYSQVYYMDKIFAMGHVVIRRKRNVVGDEPQYVILFRCVQNMNPDYPFNTCYTGGIVKLEVGDHLEILIPRPTANVSLDGEATFLGAVKLA